jgi:hypothetical protein
MRKRGKRMAKEWANKDKYDPTEFRFGESGRL